MNVLKNTFLFLFIFCGIIFFCTEPTTSKFRNSKNITSGNGTTGKGNSNQIVKKDGLTGSDNSSGEVNESPTNEVPSEESNETDIKKEDTQGTNSADFFNTDNYINIATVERTSPKEEHIKKVQGETTSNDSVSVFKSETTKDVTENEEEGITGQQKNETAATTSDSVTTAKQEGNQRDFIKDGIEDYDQYKEINGDEYDEDDEEDFGDEEYEDEEYEGEKATAEVKATKDTVEKEEEQVKDDTALSTQKKNDVKDKTEGVSTGITDTLKTETNADDNEHGISGFKIKIRRMWNQTNIFRIFEKPVSGAASVNYFRNEMQNDFAFRNGLYFSCTSAYMYNKYVDSGKYAYIRLPSNSLVILVTANKLFFQDLIYSSNKYLSIKNKFAYLMNSIIDDLRGKPFFRNYGYQYLFRNDPFALDPTRKLLDFDLLGELSEVTQMIYTDVYNNEKVSMHKIYGGWFQFLGIMVVNGYYYNDTTKPEPIEVVPYNMLGDFKELLNKTPANSNNYSYALGLWRDFPNDKFAPWRYSLELLLWDVLNILPNQLPHPAKFVLAYTKFVDKEINQKELSFFSDNDKIGFSNTNKMVYTKEDLLNWHLLVKKIVKEQKGLDVAIVAADDYYKTTNENHTEIQNKVAETDKHILKKEGYILLLLLNSEFFHEKNLLEGNYDNNKKRNFFKRVVSIIDKIQEILNAIKHTLDPDVEPDVKFYNYLNQDQRYKVFNPHILGSIAGITRHLKCENAKHFQCTHDVSVHYKYGGWFQFGGALYINKIISIPLQYKKREILKQEYEQSILLQANSSYQAAGLWRDIPEKDTSPYRYPLQAFVLENPSLNIVNIQNAHPFMVIDLINKGLQVMKRNVTGNDDDNISGDSEKENKGIKGITVEEKNLEDTIETEEEAKLVEQKMADLEKQKNLQAPSEFNLNFNEPVEDLDALTNLEKNVNDVIDEMFDVKGEGMDEDVDETIENDGENDGEGLGEDKKGKKKEMDLKAAIENPNINLADTLKYVVESSILKDDEDNVMNEIEHVYDHNSVDHDLNLLEGEEKGFNNIQGKFLLFLLILLLTIFITVAIYTGIKIYERFFNKKVKDKNEVVLAFKDKEDIPVVHGMPAPWLKT